MKVIATVEARMGATRLPQKTLMDVAGKTLLERVVERLRLAKSVGEIVVATTSNPLDDEIVKLCQREEIEYFRGSEDDVLDRVYKASLKYRADIVVQSGADCPFYDPELIDILVGIAKWGGYDYVANDMKLTFPNGVDAHIIPFNVLEACAKEATRLIDREDVPRYIWDRPERFKIFNLEAVPNSTLNRPEVRLTVDYPEDFELVVKIYKSIYPQNPNFSTFDIIELLDKNLGWIEINKHCKQKSAAYVAHPEQTKKK